MTLDELLSEVSKKADEAQHTVLKRVLGGMQRRHTRGGEPGCACSYCSQLPTYVESILRLHRAKRREWHSELCEDANLEHLQTQLSATKQIHDSLKMLDQI